MTSPLEPRPDWWPESLFPVESRFMQVDDHHVHYVDEGEGPVLLLLHGNPTWSLLYRDIIAGLAHRFRCVALDYPGFGLSRAKEGYDFLPASHAEVVASFVRQLDLTEITLMVQDWGGPIGLRVAGRAPERFRALVIGNTWCWPVDGDRHFEWFSRLMGGPVGRFAITHFNAFVNVLIPGGVRRHRIDRQVMRAYRGPFRTRASRWPTHVFPREILASRDFLAEVERDCATLSHLPALILWGDRDFAFRARERERFQRCFLDHSTRILEGAGHFIQEDASDEIVEAIAEWFDGTACSRG